MDVVFIEGSVEGACKGGVEDGGGEGESDDEEGGDAGDDCGGEAAEAGEEGEETDEDLDDGADYCDEVADEHPFCDGFVGIEAVAELLAEEFVHARVVEAPHFDGVEPEFVGVRTAVIHVVADAAGAVSGEVARAVVPEADVVEVFDVKGGLDGGGRFVDDCVRQGIGWEVDEGGVDVYV